VRLELGRRLGDVRIVAAERAHGGELPDERVTVGDRLRQLTHREDGRRQFRRGVARDCRGCL
jgi:hypothetical protein